jgi:hypothetical protein
VIGLFLISGAALFTSGNLGPGERDDRSNRWVIAVFAANLPAYTDRNELWTL